MYSMTGIEMRLQIVEQLSEDGWVRRRRLSISRFSQAAGSVTPTATPMVSALNLRGDGMARKESPSAACAQPVAPGDYLVLYATGLGKTTPDGDPNGTPLASGLTPPVSGHLLYNTMALPTVTIAGIQA